MNLESLNKMRGSKEHAILLRQRSPKRQINPAYELRSALRTFPDRGRDYIANHFRITGRFDDRFLVAKAQDSVGTEFFKKKSQGKIKRIASRENLGKTCSQMLLTTKGQSPSHVRSNA